MSRAAIIRAEAPVVTSTLGTTLVLINQLNSVSGQFEPRMISVANLIAGGADTPLLNLGASGTAGTLNIFPATASKGHLQLIATNNTGNTVTTITNAAMGQASVISVPDPGNATAAFVLDHGTQTVGGAKTFTSDITTSTANVIVATAGKGLQIKEGSNARMGTATLSSGTITIANTSVTANTRIFVSRYSINSSTALGTLSVGTVTGSTSFVIDSRKTTDATVETNDVSIVHWILIEPAA